jgi:hypothetical protein
VHQLDVMERQLAGIENAVNNAAVVNRHSNLLPAREEFVLVERIDVLQVILRLRARQELHAPALEVGGRSATQAVMTSSLLRPQ